MSITERISGFFNKGNLGETPSLPGEQIGKHAYVTRTSPVINTYMNGDKFFGGFGLTQLQTIDYWTLRLRSVDLFNNNLYARGIIRRLVTNEIGTGLTLESIPNDEVLGIPEEELQEWANNVENLFGIWGENKLICDWKKQRTFGQIQALARQTALVAGDVLVVLRYDRTTGLPRIQLIDGSLVKNPTNSQSLRSGHRIVHGVELDAQDRQVAYWVQTKDELEYKRVPAFGEKSGRRIAWLYYGTDKLLDNVRGQPFLSLVLQSLKEIDRYRDSEQRAAVINASLAMFVKKTEDKPGTLPFSNGAVRQGTISTTAQQDGQTRQFQATEQIPGLVIEELQTGEEPTSYDTRRPNVNFANFETAIVAALSWANEIPPEILLLSFNSNYSASKAAINEFKMYLTKVRKYISWDLCKPIYEQWLLQETLSGKIEAEGLLEAWRDPSQYDIYGAWIMSDFQGQIKPSVDLGKDVDSYMKAVDRRWVTNDRASKELFGTKFSSNVKRVTKENEELGLSEEEVSGMEAKNDNSLDSLIEKKIVSLISDNEQMKESAG